MRVTYGVVWRDGHAPLARGKLELLEDALRLEGVAGAGPVEREIPYDELDSVRTGRASTDRLNGQPTLVLEQRGRTALLVSAVAQTGVVAELTEQLAKLAIG